MARRYFLERKRNNNNNNNNPIISFLLQKQKTKKRLKLVILETTFLSLRTASVNLVLASSLSFLRSLTSLFVETLSLRTLCT